MKEIAKGVQLFRLGEPLAQISHPKVNIELLAAGQKAEVMRFTFLPGATFGLVSDPKFDGLECYVLLEGRLVTHRNGERIVIQPGDTIEATPAEEACMLEAETAGTALYVSSAPFFHFLDKHVRELVGMAVDIEIKDGYTSDHCSRMQTLARKVGTKLELPHLQLFHLTWGALLHDIGKVKIPGHILGKPGPLTPEEWVIMRRHAEWGRQMLKESALPEAAIIVGQHHERFDGSGYPHGLKGDQICLEARIVAVCDSWDAMTTDRVYRKALSRAEAIADLQRGAGVLYDPAVVAAFLSIIDEDGSGI